MRGLLLEERLQEILNTQNEGDLKMPRTAARSGGKRGRRGRPSALARISTGDLRRELERRQGMLADLVRQRDALSAELAELEAVFGAIPSVANEKRGPGRPRGPVGRPRGAGRRGRGRNATSLATSLHSVLNGKTMSVAEVADAVQKAGYRTTSPNFRTIVNQALISNPKAFKKVARGQYTSR